MKPSPSQKAGELHVLLRQQLRRDLAINIGAVNRALLVMLVW